MGSICEICNTYEVVESTNYQRCNNCFELKCDRLGCGRITKVTLWDDWAIDDIRVSYLCTQHIRKEEIG